MTETLLVPAAAAIILANLPFGYWRANVRKYSAQWILAIHIPVVLAVLLRMVAGIPFEPMTVAVMSAAFVFGQLAGQRTRTVLAAVLPVQLTSCLPWDLIRALIS